MARPMSMASRRARQMPIAIAPREAWYPLASSSDVGGLSAVDALGTAIALYRTSDGTAIALEDCCAHRPYPLSHGQLLGDIVRCGLCGFEYAPTGECVRVPTQERVPVGAAVRAFPVREDHGVTWVWFGEPGRARLHRIPDVQWLVSEPWVTVGGHQHVAANYLLLHESLADVTKIPVLAPEMAPAALEATPPPLDVVVTETTVSLSRQYPPTVLPGWQADALGVHAEREYVHMQEGHFHSPAVWVDHWDVSNDQERHRMRFTHLMTPVDARTTRLSWYVSRDFATGDDRTSERLLGMFQAYYRRLGTALEHTQRLLDREPRRREVSVSADAAALRVRDIVRDMLAEEGTATSRRS